MNAENFNDLYFYKELFGEDFLLYTDEITPSHTKEDLQTQEFSTQESLTQDQLAQEPLSHEPLAHEFSDQENNSLENIQAVFNEISNIQNKKNNLQNSEINTSQPTEHISENSTTIPMAQENNLSVRDKFIEYYKLVLESNFCPLYRRQRPFIFGGGNVNDLEIVLLYNEASEHDEKNIKKPMTDPNGMAILSKLKENGVNLKKSFIAPIIKCRVDKSKNELSSTVIDANIKITLNQIKILNPPLVVVFGLDLGLTLIKSSLEKTDFSKGEKEFLHNLRNRLITAKTRFKAIVTYDYNELLYDKTKMNEFFEKDLPFIVRQYKELI